LAPPHGDADKVLLHHDLALLRHALLLCHGLPPLASRILPIKQCRMRGGNKVSAAASSPPAFLHAILSPPPPLLPIRLCGEVRVDDNLLYLRHRHRHRVRKIFSRAGNSRATRWQALFM